MHEQSRGNIVEKLTVIRSREILNDKVKMEILEMLKKKGPSSFGGIVRDLGVSQQSATNHILELKLLGLIEKKTDPPNFNLNEERYSTLISFSKDD